LIGSGGVYAIDDHVFVLNKSADAAPDQLTPFTFIVIVPFGVGTTSVSDVPPPHEEAIKLRLTKIKSDDFIEWLFGVKMMFWFN